jgi:hypothetical protein
MIRTAAAMIAFAAGPVIVPYLGWYLNDFLAPMWGNTMSPTIPAWPDPGGCPALC